MNEADFIRRQLALERSHLSEILQAVRRDGALLENSRAVADYIEWGSGRLLATSAPDPDTRGQLAGLSGADRAERLLALIAACSDPVRAEADRTLGIVQWRRVAQLSADTILQERQLYGAARDAVGPT